MANNINKKTYCCVNFSNLNLIKIE